MKKKFVTLYCLMSFFDSLNDMGALAKYRTPYNKNQLHKKPWKGAG